ncbi:MAG: PQQ-binding-like beta-propeller repeat protein [Candidatus Bathyarchaeia archaeon]
MSSKVKILAICSFLMLTFALAAYLPATNAHTPPWNIPTFAYISVAADPVGKGQTVIVYMWLDKVPPTATGPWGDRWENFTLKITKPNGQVQLVGPIRSDPIGFAWHALTPDQVGTYKLKMYFSGQTLEGKNLSPGQFLGVEYIGDYFMPSESDEITLTVQEEPVPNYPEPPLPRSYWTRPIDAQNHEWYKISGNWLRTTELAPYTEAPETPHIVWTKPLTFGGLVGGELGDTSFHDGNAYEGKWWPPVIIGGILYYNEWPASMAYSEGFGMASYYLPGAYAVDLRTGEQVWYNPNLRIDFGQVYRYDSMNQHGAFAYLWRAEGTTWMCYDAWTGRWLFNVTNVPGVVGLFGTPWIFGPKGEILMPVLGPPSPPFGPPAPYKWLAIWNPMSIPGLTGAADIPFAPLNGTAGQMWRPYNKVVNGITGYMLNVTLSEPITGSVVGVLDNYKPDRILVSTLPTIALTYTPLVNFTIYCVSIKSGEEGRVLWKQTYSASDFVEGGGLNWGVISLEDKVFTLWCPQTRQHWGFSLENGKKIWGPTKSQPAWDFTVATTHAAAYGKLFSFGMAGVLHCYNIKTGELLWTREVEVPYLSESKWGGNYPACTLRIADEKIYLFTGEHSPDDPKERGSPLAVVDINGTMLWRIPFYASHWAANPAIADGYLVYMNAYDNRIYSFGKGQTATRLSASPKVVSKGSSVLIEGSVTDLSPAVAGTPAVADENMASWMEYLVMQKPMPQTVGGVNVELYAVDEAGATTYIDTVCTDPLNGGVFRKLWTPPKEGTYIITAVFAGTKSYWDSYASTAVGVTAALPETATAEQAGTMQSAIESLQSAVQSLQPLTIALAVLVIIAIVIGMYSIYDHRKLLRK